jgi:hypothetical protein
MIHINAGRSRRRQRDRLAAALRDTDPRHFTADNAAAIAVRVTGLALTPATRRGDRFAYSPIERETLLRSAQVFATLAAAQVAQS